MTSRERVQISLAHREPDRIPVDFGGTTVSGMHALCVERLRATTASNDAPSRCPFPIACWGWLKRTWPRRWDWT